MRAHIRWTPDLDERLRALRRMGLSWDGIAVAMELGRNTVLERGRKIGARAKPPQKVIAASEPRDRPPRQAGHPETWGLLTDGTVLAGSAYPYPVFL